MSSIVRRTTWRTLCLRPLPFAPSRIGPHRGLADGTEATAGASSSTGSANEFAKDRKRWRKSVSSLRKQYAEEFKARAEEEMQRKAAVVAKIKEQKAERLAMKLQRSAETRQRLAHERERAAEELEARRAVSDTNRSERESQMRKRLIAMVEYLEEESKLWLTPEGVDTAIDENFLDKPGIVGHFAERSPYWGYVAQVETFDGSRFDTRTGTSIPRTPEEAMAIATHLMQSSSNTYAEFKDMREDPEGLQEFIEMLRTIEIDDPDGRPSMMTRREPLVQYDSAQRPEMPSLQPQEHEKRKLEEQLARLRARRQRPPPAP